MEQPSRQAHAPIESPLTWCASPRIEEPLLRDAIRFGFGDDPQATSFRNMNHVERIAADVIAIVHAEAVCEAAARAYDALEYRGTARQVFRPVLVVRVGRMYLVDDVRPRGDGFFAVYPFDDQWRPGFGAFGDGH